MKEPRSIRRDLKQYFTDASEVSEALCQLLGPVDSLSVLEPSVGTGSLLERLQGSPSRIVGIDIDPEVLETAHARLSHLPLTTKHADFIQLFLGDLFGESEANDIGQFDAVISNPPFGLHLDPRIRRDLRRKFPQLYVRESYGLFVAFSLAVLKPGGTYSFLLPDTFLTSRAHWTLRRLIAEKGEPTHIVRFDPKRFESINFGYGKLCLIAGRRRALTQHSKVLWVDATGTDVSLNYAIENHGKVIDGGFLLTSIETGWRQTPIDPALLGTAWTRLGDIAECKTGIYTGDNLRFIGFDPERVGKRLNGHPIAWGRQVELHPSHIEMQKGLTGSRRYVPLIRGGHREFNDATAWAIDWSPEALKHYKSNKKARFQNANFYFRPGLAVPMVTSGRISASLMENAVFDQGVVGVFAKDESMHPALLLYLNSTLASKFRNNLVNGGTNTSANYLKQLPVPAFSDSDLQNADALVYEARRSANLAREVCDSFVNGALTKLDKQSDRMAAA